MNQVFPVKERTKTACEVPHGAFEKTAAVNAAEKIKEVLLVFARPSGTYRSSLILQSFMDVMLTSSFLLDLFIRMMVHYAFHLCTIYRLPFLIFTLALVHICRTPFLLLVPSSFFLFRCSSLHRCPILVIGLRVFTLLVTSVY